MDSPVSTEASRSPWPVVGTVCVGAFMAALDASIVNVATPTLTSFFHSTLADVEWVSLSYMLTLTALLPTLGRVADLFGRTAMYKLGFLVFVLGSALCGAAPTLWILVAARVLQGLGAAFLQANSIAIITAATAPRLRGRAIGVQGAAQALGLAVGPTVGGLLVSLFGWRAIFYVNVPVGALGIILGILFLQRVPETRRSVGQTFDFLGAALFALAAVPLFWALTQAVEHSWASPAILLPLVAGVGFLVLLIAWERRHPHPLLPGALFRVRAITIGSITGLLSFAVMYGVLFLMPFYFEYVRGLPPSSVGLLLTPVPLAMALVTPIAGYLADRFGSRKPLLAGMALATAASFALAILQPATPLFVEALMLAGVGLGQGLFTPPNNTSVMASAPASHLGLVGGVLNMARSLGTSFGVALAGTVFSLYLGTRPDQATTAQLVLALRPGFLVLAFLGVAGLVLIPASSRAHA